MLKFVRREEKMKNEEEMLLPFLVDSSFSLYSLFTLSS